MIVCSLIVSSASLSSQPYATSLKTGAQVAFLREEHSNTLWGSSCENGLSQPASFLMLSQASQKPSGESPVRSTDKPAFLADLFLPQACSIQKPQTVSFVGALEKEEPAPRFFFASFHRSKKRIPH